MRANIYVSTGRRASPHFALLLAGALGLTMVGAGCQAITITRTHGYVQSQEMIDQVPEGSSREHVQFVLGTPSTTATFGNEVYYYVTQRTETIAFLEPRIVDQRVLAVYFDEYGTVTNIANYGLEDGRVIDFIGRRTPTTGAEVTFLRQIMQAAAGQNI